ncbi:MAG: S-methyl-5-thioribose-1-phosphate isomerase [Fusobacteria bacterium]|nr:S-methyl-5-thioribose-1-phosphate isomerase [Fusobacteriota bacterium]
MFKNEPVTPIYRVGGKVFVLDQTRLPKEVVYGEISSIEEMYQWIKELKIRGAPAIGIAGAYGIYIALRNKEKKLKELNDFTKYLREAAAYLISARPTAVNLQWAILRVEGKLLAAKSLKIDSLVALSLEEADAIREEDENICFQIGINGSSLLKDCQSILTHCNAGTIATAKYGTALAPIYYLSSQGSKLKVYADETRPLLQGARLTAWELMEAGIDVTLITDSMAGVVMAKGLVDCVIVGADRIAANGDTANKIGTYALSILAKAHGIPFYVAAPFSTFDLNLENGSGIVIEERSGDEVRYFGGSLVAPAEVKVFNPAFDVTPYENISAIITEKAIILPPFNENINKYLVMEKNNENQAIDHR